MFKKRNFRKKADISGIAEEDAVNQNEEESPALPPVAPKNPNKVKSKSSTKSDNLGKGIKSSSSKSLLSFEEEGDEGPSIVLKKSTIEKDIGGKSHKHKAKKEREKDGDRDKSKPSAADEDTSTQRPRAGMYTDEMLKQLKNETKSKSVTPKSDSHPMIKLQGSFKPAGNVANDIDGAHMFGLLPIHQKAEDRESKGGKVTSDLLHQDKKEEDAPSESKGNDFFIPDAAAIKAAKLKRERMRQAAEAPEFMPLRSSEHESERGIAKESKKKGSDSSGESEDEDGDVRLQFVGSGKGKKGNQPDSGGVFKSLNEGEELGEEEQDEEEAWVLEQLKKGVGGIRSGDERPNAATAAKQAMEEHAKRVAASLLAARGPRSNTTSQLQSQGEASLQALQQGAKKLRQAKLAAENALKQTDASLASSMASLAEYQGEQDRLAAKYESMQELRDYVADLCDCLQDKAPLIEELEEHMQRTTEHRATAFTDRRRTDREEEYEEIEAGVLAAMGALGRGEGPATLGLIAVQAQQAAMQAKHHSSGVQVDEFGRDMNLGRRMESDARKAARSKRRAKAQARRQARMERAAPEEGIRELGETDSSESEGEVATYTRQHEEVLDTSDGVFADAAAEFAQLQYVKNRLEQWKAHQSDSYKDCYVSMSAPSLLAPFVRLELLTWSPLFKPKGLDSMDWYQQLFSYGMEGGAELEEDDADANMVPHLIEKVVLPIVHHAVECWDPFSEGQSTALAKTTEELLIYIEKEAQVMQEMLVAINRQLSSSLSEVSLCVWPSQALAATPGAAELAARQFGEAVRLGRNIGGWRGVLGEWELRALLLDQLVAKKMVPHLHTVGAPLDALLRIERVLDMIPDHWLLQGLPSGLDSFQELITSIVTNLRRRSALGDTETGRRLVKLLKKISDHSTARSVAKAFDIRT